jgi:hypothetical protein
MRLAALRICSTTTNMAFGIREAYFASQCTSKFMQLAALRIRHVEVKVHAVGSLAHLQHKRKKTRTSLNE